MTAAAAVPAVVRRRRPRLDVPSRDRDPHAGLPGPQPQPRGELACQSAPSTFAAAERAVEVVTALRVSPSRSSVVIGGRRTPASEPIAEVLAWCAGCPIRARCYQTMTAGTYRYTGIAGGVILHQGEPYVPRSSAKTPTSYGVSSF